MEKIIIFLFISAVVINGSAIDSLNKTTPTKTNTFWYSLNQTDSLHIPLYKKYSLTKNYIFNQAILGGFRGIAIGFLSGGGIGLLYDSQKDLIFIPTSLVLGIICGQIAFVSGTGFGIVRGVWYNRLEKSSTYFHTRRMQFGYQYCLTTFAPIKPNGLIRFKMIDWPVGWYLIFRPLSNNIFIPDKIEIGIEQDWWGQGDYGELELHRAEIRSRFNLYNKNLLTVYISAGLGYEWGHEVQYLKSDVVTNPIDCPFLRMYTGSEINLFDLIFADVAASFEPIGPYYFTKNKKYYPYVQNFQISISFGTYIF